MDLYGAVGFDALLYTLYVVLGTIFAGNHFTDMKAGFNPL